jgi:hypothetical protein
MSGGYPAGHVAMLLALLVALAAAPQAAHGAAVLDGPTSDEVSSITQSGCPCKENWSFGAYLTGINGCSNPDMDLKVRPAVQQSGRAAGHWLVCMLRAVVPVWEVSAASARRHVGVGQGVRK